MIIVIMMWSRAILGHFLNKASWGKLAIAITDATVQCYSSTFQKEYPVEGFRISVHMSQKVRHQKVPRDCHLCVSYYNPVGTVGMTLVLPTADRMIWNDKRFSLQIILLDFVIRSLEPQKSTLESGALLMVQTITSEAF